MFDFILNFPIWLQVICYVVLFILGVFFLVRFCDIFVDSASDIATKLKIPPIIIGLTIVAMGTSFPELAVSVSDSIATISSGANANIALGNVVGSNICNILLVLGCSTLTHSIKVDKSIVKREIPFLLLVTIVASIFGIFFGDYVIYRWEAIILVGLMIIYTIILIKGQMKKNDLKVPETENKKQIKLFKTIVLLLVGLAGIVVGGEIVVVGAKGLALIGTDAFKIDRDLAESLVGLTIVAVGTSLPELVTSIIAAKKHQNEIALGNVIGSNIFNILFVLGISGTIAPLTSGPQILIDLCVMVFVTIILYVYSLSGKFKEIHGYSLVIMYVFYLGYLIIRTVV